MSRESELRAMNGMAGENRHPVAESQRDRIEDGEAFVLAFVALPGAGQMGQEFGEALGDDHSDVVLGGPLRLREGMSDFRLRNAKTRDTLFECQPSDRLDESYHPLAPPRLLCSNVLGHDDGRLMEFDQVGDPLKASCVFVFSNVHVTPIDEIVRPFKYRKAEPTVSWVDGENAFA